MSSDPKWSVVITSYGVGRRIERAVRCILEQTVAPVELVVVDDASNDTETTGALDGIGGSVATIRLSERRGVGVARNTGLRATSRPFVLCLDGDDWVDPTYLETAQTVFETRRDVGIVSAWVRFEGERSGEWRPEDFGLVDLLACNRISSASAFRREASEAVGFYAEDLFGYEDWDHWIAITAEGWRVHVVPEVQIHYEWRSGSLGRSSDGQARRLVEQIVSRHEGLFRENVGPVLGAMLERVLRLEGQSRSLSADLEKTTGEIQRVWCLVGELGGKLEVQDCSVTALTHELERTRQRILELEAIAATANDPGKSIVGLHED